MPINIVVPEVGESLVDARVARWLKKAGEAVAAGEALVELETDKVDVEVAAPRAGVLKTIAHGDGADVKIGEVLGTIEEHPAKVNDTTEKGKNEGTEKSKGEGTEKIKPTSAAATPSARKLAREQKVDLNDV